MADLIEVEDLSVDFDNRGTMVPALRGISFRIRAGSTVALVSESGSGKSVTAQAMMGILPKTARITSGKIMWKLPMFGESSVERILAEAEASRRAHTAHHVRLIGYDSARQTLGTAMVIHRGDAA